MRGRTWWLLAIALIGAAMVTTSIIALVQGASGWGLVYHATHVVLGLCIVAAMARAWQGRRG